MGWQLGLWSSEDDWVQGPQLARSHDRQVSAEHPYNTATGFPHTELSKSEQGGSIDPTSAVTCCHSTELPGPLSLSGVRGNLPVG